MREPQENMRLLPGKDGGEAENGGLLRSRNISRALQAGRTTGGKSGQASGVLDLTSPVSGVICNMEESMELLGDVLRKNLRKGI